MKAKKHGIYYGARPLAGGKFGIVVAIYKKGEWIETDLNTYPWPSEARAIAEAKGAAEGIENNSWEYKGLPILAGSGPMEAAVFAVKLEG